MNKALSAAPIPESTGDKQTARVIPMNPSSGRKQKKTVAIKKNIENQEDQHNFNYAVFKPKKHDLF